MVKDGNIRVMITFTPKTKEKAENLMEIYDMKLTNLIQMLINEKYSERNRG